MGAEEVGIPLPKIIARIWKMERKRRNWVRNHGAWSRRHEASMNGVHGEGRTWCIVPAVLHESLSDKQGAWLGSGID